MSGVRNWFDRAARIGVQLRATEQFVTVRGFLRALSVVYFIAFCSLGVQVMGLVGSHGILPVADYLKAMREASIPWRQAPTLLWLSPSDDAIRVLWIVGMAAAAMGIMARWPRPSLAICLVCWISLCVAGQEFLSFQWDLLLSEAGFLALFANEGRVSVWLFRWLLFRLMFFSGVVKLMSGDPTWRNLTAMHYHYETQPLPTPLAWFMDQLPLGFQKASTAFTFFAELLVPVLFFATRPVRILAAAFTVALQLLILATGNYAFFNWLTIALCMWLVIEPRPEAGNRYVAAAVAVFIGVVSGFTVLSAFDLTPPGAGAVLHATAPFRVVNTYGLFAVMTTERPEIIVEGSNDGVNWAAYEFRYKVGDVRRAPPIVAPHQPRLDWQMWFAALGTYQQNRWFVNFMIRLLQGEPAVTRLLNYNPFANGPPKYVRARVYLYHFTRWGAREWWTREERGMYLPAVGLK